MELLMEFGWRTQEDRLGPLVVRKRESWDSDRQKNMGNIPLDRRDPYRACIWVGEEVLFETYYLLNICPIVRTSNSVSTHRAYEVVLFFIPKRPYNFRGIQADVWYVGNGT